MMTKYMLDNLPVNFMNSITVKREWPFIKMVSAQIWYENTYEKGNTQSLFRCSPLCIDSHSYCINPDSCYPLKSTCIFALIPSLTPIWGILGFELASFLDKKSNANDCIQIWGFFKKNFILGTELASFSDKKTRTHSSMFVQKWRWLNFQKIFLKIMRIHSGKWSGFFVQKWR